MKETIYHKTSRLNLDGNSIRITEKMDGSNLAFIKFNNELYIAQRNYVYKFTEIQPNNLYKGLFDWLDKYADDLLDSLNDNTVIFGEWIGMGKIKYNFQEDERFFMFAKAQVHGLSKDDIINLRYQDFQYAFDKATMPSFINSVPFLPNISYNDINEKRLDEIYKDYKLQVNRDVEGFVIGLSEKDKPVKYIRYKNGIETPHMSNYKKQSN